MAQQDMMQGPTQPLPPLNLSEFMPNWMQGKQHVMQHDLHADGRHE